MNSASPQSLPGPLRLSDVAAVLARWFLGVTFIYLGLGKALHPVDFLKLVRQYDVLPQPLLLNFVVSTLPWFEVFCGALLVLGIAVRGAAAMLVAMLIPFTGIVLLRALDIHQAGGLSFCSIKFDCGCGAGEVFICRKLVENVFLIALAAALMVWRTHALCLRHSIFQTFRSLSPLRGEGRGEG